MWAFLFLVALAAAVWLWLKKAELERAAALKTGEASRAALRVAQLEAERDDLLARVKLLEKYQRIVDAEEAAAAVLADAAAQLAKADVVLADANKERQAGLAEAQKQVTDARYQAALVIADARKRAQDIAGEAHGAMTRARDLSAVAEAMQGVLKGYGDAYIVPTYSLLDDLARDFGHTEAGGCLKRAREVSRAMVQANRAAVCDYAEEGRRETAVRFVVDAFNGKVDSILSRVRAENHGKLAQEIRGAFALVNHNGMAFRNARIVEEYLDSRLEELRWAATVYALREREREEQRAVRERMRDEERARREFERAMREAAQEEEAIKKAMERVQAQVAKAGEEQRAAFEAKLRELEGRLAEAEERGRRALSMAQQTKVGHVYVISNEGSFGDSVFKIGMTRRLEPTDRVRELGDASVPFEFDIHAMIYSEDAPALERELHLQFMRAQVNKVNPRKEFFRLGLAEVRAYVERRGISAHWTMAAEAHEYRESLKIEQQIKENPALAREWEGYQIEAENAPMPAVLDEAVEE